MTWKLERHLHWFDGSAKLCTDDQPALREFFQIDSPQNIANGLGASTGSLGLLNAYLRVDEDTRSYSWGHPAYAFLLEVMKRSRKWADLITKQGRALLKLIEVRNFELQTADSRRPLHGNRIVHWPLPADLFKVSEYAWGKLDPWPSDSSDLPRFTFPAVSLEVRYAFAVARYKSWMVNKPKSLSSSCAVAGFESREPCTGQGPVTLA